MLSFSNLVFPPLSVAYGAITRLRTTAYEKGLLKTVRLPVPVISVGNITVGGTGKTPLVAKVSRILADEGRRVCVLTRGYGRVNVADRVVVSDGETTLTDVRKTGDEALLLAQDLKGLVAVVCDTDRAAAGEWAIDNLKSDVFVLDDGFQHLQLARDLNILAIDATNPWGGDHLLPFGRLREAKRGVSRADCIIITRTEQVSDCSDLKRQIQNLSGGRPILTSQMQTTRFRNLASAEPAPSDAIPQPVAAFCGVGNPEAFFNNLRSENLHLVHTQTFPDHHFYTQSDIVDVAQKAKQLGAASLITTAKDAVKLAGIEIDLPCYVLEIEILICEEGKLRDLISNTLGSR